ncbi:CD209 antigen-like protein E [Cyprinus carpio]|uniref:CD209 antigen-like protein E n=1 Tax=Cyprinus carpio TaxID=7962 RepID=A0A8C1EGM1_CYPCA|nr:CD209 antigen-like protein E [Cyprinus carpio]
MSTELKSWSDSRQYCRERGADLVIINTEEKQRHMSSYIKERVWIGLSDRENEGIMKWVDNSPLNRGFWTRGQPDNNQGENEDCIELMPSDLILNNWNDLPCSQKKKGICEK